MQSRAAVSNHKGEKKGGVSAVGRKIRKKKKLQPLLENLHGPFKAAEWMSTRGVGGGVGRGRGRGGGAEQSGAQLLFKNCELQSAARR